MKQTYGKAGGSSFFAESSRPRLDSLEHYSEPSSHTSRGAREVSELATIGHAHIERYLSYDLILPKTNHLHHQWWVYRSKRREDSAATSGQEQVGPGNFYAAGT
jgi:hypothetical protein